jgi:hypothetical protein
MDCIYMNSDNTQHYCHAQPLRLQNEPVKFYPPTETERKQFCNDSANFTKCPRFLAMQDTFKTEYRK